MESLVSFEELKRLYMKRSILDREADEEVKNLFILEMTFIEICETSAGKTNSRSLVTQMRKWKETLNERAVSDLFLFCSLNRAIESFKEYLLSKYTGKKQREFEQLLSIHGIERDLKKLMAALIYEHKGETAKAGGFGFFSADAQRQYIVHDMYKRNRSLFHEAIRAGIKTMDDKVHYSREELIAIIGPVIEVKVQKAVRDYIPSPMRSDEKMLLLSEFNEEQKLL